MKILAGVVVAMIAAGAVAQTAAPAIDLPDGTSIAARLLTTVKTNKANNGDEVGAAVAVAVLLGGHIVVPQEARLVGHVLAATPRSKQNRESILLIRFERVEWHEGSAALNAYIVGNLRNLPRAISEDCFPRRRMFPQRVLPSHEFVGQQVQVPNPGNSPQPIHNTGSDPRMAGMGDDLSLPCRVAGAPDLHHIRVRKLDDPPGATQLVSESKNITLSAGIIVELRQVAP